MTEFVVSAAFVAVPLFLIVPTMAKFVDMKLANVQAARYTVWEYTSHYESGSDQPLGFRVSNYQMPTKDHDTVVKEAKRRLYSKTDLPIITGDSSWTIGDGNGLWRYHTGDPMYRGDSQGRISHESTPAGPGIIGDLMEGGMDILEFTLDLMATILDWLGINAGFNAVNTKGMYRSTMSMGVEAVPGYSALDRDNRTSLFTTRNDSRPFTLNCESKAGLLTGNWGAGGKAHTVYQVGGLVPTVVIDKILNDPLPIQDIISVLFLSPELGPNYLKFGHPVNDPGVMDEVPVGKLKDDDRGTADQEGNQVPECEGNYCVY